jgi:hypothetical protein
MPKTSEVIDIENHDEIAAAADGGDGSGSREHYGRSDEAKQQLAEIELLRLQRAEISNRVWIALLTFALAILTAFTAAVPIIVQDFTAQRRQGVTVRK